MCAPGVEAITATELRDLGLVPGRPSRGLVPFSATTRNVYAANLWLRTATRVVIRVASFDSRDLDALEARAAGIDAGPWLWPGAAVRLRVTTHRCRLVHSGAVAERLARGAGLRQVGMHDEGVLVVVRGTHDRFTVSVDTSGEALHRRGWRLATAKAPLRPTLAAALLLGSGWTPEHALVDPFCGSGTIAIEAARLARRLPPAAGRRFAFEDAPGFEPGTWASVTGAAADRALDRAPSPIVARDRDAGAVESAAGNAQRAGVAADVDLQVASVSELAAPREGWGADPWIVTNPPWGGRVGGGDLRNLYARLGAVCRQRLPGGHLALLAADPVLAGHTGLRLRERFRTVSGGVDVRALTTG